MTKEQIINQLESLKAHCEDFVDRDEEDSVWKKDVEALGNAIEMLKEHNKERNGMVEWKTEIGVIYTYETQDKLKLYDSDEEYIGYVEIGNKTTNEVLKIINKLLKIKHISDLVDLGFCENVLFSDGLVDLKYHFIDYGIEEGIFEIENEEEIDYKTLLEDYESYFEINRIGRYYFMVDFCEYY